MMAELRTPEDEALVLIGVELGKLEANDEWRKKLQGLARDLGAKLRLGHLKTVANALRYVLQRLREMGVEP